MLSDIENLDIMLGENHYSMRERDGSLNSNLPRRSRSSVSNESENGEGDIGTQVLPQIQNVIMAGSGHGTRKG